jgi:hypothetical protein
MQPHPVGSRPHAGVAALIVLVLVALASASAGAVVGPQQIVAGPEDQLLAAANATYLIWTANSEAFPKRYHAYGRVRGTTGTFRLNVAGTRGSSGGIDPDQDRAIYEQIDGRSSDLYWIDLVTRVRHKLPPAINSARPEWGPRISNTFYLFARDGATATTLFLFDRATKTKQKLVSYDRTRYHVEPGAVGERYATWTACRPFRCDAFVRDTVTDQTRKIPTPDGRSRHAPVVHEADGQVYFVRSGSTCGASVRIMRVPVSDLGATPVSLVALPEGIDVGYQLSVQEVRSRVDLWFARYRCGPRQGDVYRLLDVGPV